MASSVHLPSSTEAISASSSPFASWAQSQLNLLQLEQEEGLARHETCSRKLTVNKLQLSEVRIGAFGKTTLTLSRDKAIPPQALSVGSPVRITCPRWGSEEDPANERRGIVKACEENRIEIICKGGDRSRDDGILQPSNEHDVTVESLPDEITIKRINKALSNPASGRWAQLLFGDATPRFRPESADFFVKHPSLDATLNDSQRKAVSLVVRAMDVAVIHGPPGTGKTTTLVKAIETLLSENPSARILCCAPSNVAVDNLVGLLGRKKFRIVRLGHPSRVKSALVEHTLDSILANSDMAELVKDAKKELMETRDFIRKRELRKEIKRREQSFIKSVIQNSQIVLSTISSSADVGKFAPDGFTFTHLIVDEAAQAMESSVWIPLQYLDPTSGVLILAGDHKQLPPTILSDRAARQGLGFTMMERIVNKHKDAGVILSTQYRMCDEIMGWSSQEMYGGVLKAHDSVSQQRLSDLLLHSKDHEDADLLDPLVFIDTTGCGLHEQEMAEDEESRCNPGEVDLVLEHVKRLLDASRGELTQDQIAVVTPYRAQVEAIKSRLAENPATDKVEVRTVDGFQGQEREAIILSMVRSNAERKVGFLADERRLNVAVTRAKRQVCMIGDALTLESNAFLQRLCKYFYDNGTVRSAAEFVQTFAPDVGAGKRLGGDAKKSSSKAKESATTKPNKTVVQATTKSEAKKATPTPPQQPSAQPKKSASISHVKTTPSAANKAIIQEDKATAKFSALAIDDDDDDDGNDGASGDVVSSGPTTSSSSSGQEVTKPKTKKKGNKGKGGNKSGGKDQDGNEGQADDDDEWAFLEAAVQEANHCPFPKCGVYVELVGKTCEFCKQRYCLAHCLEEKHGCGAAARKKARDNLTKKPGLRPTERNRLRQQLEDKIKKEEQGRAAAVPQKTSKKQ